MNTMYTKTGRLVGTGILTALIIVLQTFASGIKIANFTPPLSLIPIITGAILFGEFTGAILGFVFGIVVVMAVISGAEPFSTLMLNFNPVNDSAASAGADNTIVFFFSAFIGINFLTEVVFIAVLVPAISNIIYVIKKKNRMT